MDQGQRKLLNTPLGMHFKELMQTYAHGNKRRKRRARQDLARLVRQNPELALALIGAHDAYIKDQGLN